MERQGRINLLLCETVSRCWRNSVDVLCAIRETFTAAEEFIDQERAEAIAASVNRRIQMLGGSSSPSSPRRIPRKRCGTEYGGGVWDGAAALNPPDPRFQMTLPRFPHLFWKVRENEKEIMTETCMKSELFTSRLDEKSFLGWKHKNRQTPQGACGFYFLLLHSLLFTFPYFTLGELCPPPGLAWRPASFESFHIPTPWSPLPRRSVRGRAPPALAHPLP